MDRNLTCYERIKGPVVPLNICFNDDGSVNHEAVARYVDWLCREKVPVILLTGGSSEYSWQTEEDVWRLTETVARAVRGRSLFVTSTGLWPPRKAREFLKHADAVGADAVKIQIPLWEPPSAELFLGYFDALEGASEIPRLLWWNPAGSRAGMGGPLLDAVASLAERPHVVGIKNDGDAFYDYYSLIRSTRGKHFAVISGGQMKNFLFGYPIGSPAYLCPIAPFRPDIALQFYRHVVEGRIQEAWDIVFRYEEPILEAAGEVNWLLLMKTAIHMLGFYPGTRVGAPRHTPFGADVQEKARKLYADVFGLKRAGAG